MENEFLTLPKDVRMWWINYWKITQAWAKYILINDNPWLRTVNNHINSKSQMRILLVDLHKERYDIWSIENHFNYWLIEAGEILKKNDIDWERYQFENKMIFCEFGENKEHNECRYFEKCELRRGSNGE